MNLILLGNPGTGKSTFLNGMIRKRAFTSGFSVGKGLTQDLDTYISSNTCYMDTPGLDDVTNRREAAAAITKALKYGGTYKILFICVTDSGRIRACDKTMMELVFNAAPDITCDNYSIIINKVNKRFINDVFENDDVKKQFLDMLFAGSKKRTTFVHYNENDKDLEDEDNVVKSLNTHLRDFIYNAPCVSINKHNVKNLQYLKYDEMNDHFEKEIIIQRNENIRLRNELKRN